MLHLEGVESGGGGGGESNPYHHRQYHRHHGLLFAPHQTESEAFNTTAAVAAEEGMMMMMMRQPPLPPPPPPPHDFLLNFGTASSSENERGNKPEVEYGNFPLEHDEQLQQQRSLSVFSASASCDTATDWRCVSSRAHLQQQDISVDGPLAAIHPADQKFYRCQFCAKIFYSSQALGGHQNAHKRERRALKAHRNPSPYISQPGYSSHPLLACLQGSPSILTEPSNLNRSLGIKAHSSLHKPPPPSSSSCNSPPWSRPLIGQTPGVGKYLPGRVGQGGVAARFDESYGFSGRMMSGSSAFSDEVHLSWPGSFRRWKADEEQITASVSDQTLSEELNPPTAPPSPLDLSLRL